MTHNTGALRCAANFCATDAARTRMPKQCTGLNCNKFLFYNFSRIIDFFDFDCNLYLKHFKRFDDQL